MQLISRAFVVGLLLLACVVSVGALTALEKQELTRVRDEKRRRGIDVVFYEWAPGGQGSEGILQQKTAKVDRTVEKFANVQRWNMYAALGNNTAPADDLYYSSQVGQDELVALLSGYKSQGFFVDLASNDWRHLSNTLALEKYFNWTGICIEPLPAYALDILEQRRCKLVTNPVYSKTGDSVKFHVEHFMSGIVGSDMDNTGERGNDLVLRTVTLGMVLDSLRAPKVMDYLSLDVEGGELHVLHGVDLNVYTFLVMNVERPTAHVHHILVKHGYWFLAQLPLKTPLPHSGKVLNIVPFGEVLYIHRTHPRFREHMDTYRTATYTWRAAQIGSKDLLKLPSAEPAFDGKKYVKTVQQPWLEEPAWPPAQN